jgi:hypothetical protein
LGRKIVRAFHAYWPVSQIYALYDADIGSIPVLKDVPSDQRACWRATTLADAINAVHPSVRDVLLDAAAKEQHVKDVRSPLAHARARLLLASSAKP